MQFTIQKLKLLIAKGDQFLTPNSSFRKAACFPSSSHFQSFLRSTTCVNPLQELRLDSSHRSLLLNQLKERRPLERTRTKIETEVRTSVKASLRLTHLRHGRQKALDRRKVSPQPLLRLLLVAHRASRHTLSMPIPTRPHPSRASVRLSPIPLKLLQFVNQYFTYFHIYFSFLLNKVIKTTFYLCFLPTTLARVIKMW